MVEFRVTKYDPAKRNRAGHYPLDEWTAYDEIGRSFAGVVLTRAEYEWVERAYVEVAVAFMREAGVAALTVRGLENGRRRPLAFKDGSSLDLVAVGTVVKHMLREEFWCRLEHADAFIHIGWDFYVYVGVPHRCPAATHLAERMGLFVERFRSPYHPCAEAVDT